MAFSPVAVPPLPAWPQKALPEEPAHAVFRRLTALNHQSSAQVLAATLGVRGKNTSPEEMLEVLREFPIENFELLIAATPVIEGSLLCLNGQTFSRARDWSLANPRVCAACLEEQYRYRNWWDLTVMESCPIHCLQLVGEMGDASLSWFTPHFDVCTDGLSVLRNPKARVSMRRNFDAYLLGRMGLSEQLPNDTLDQTAVHDILPAAELLGTIAAKGFIDHGSHRIKRHGVERRTAIGQGYDLLASPILINEFLLNLARQSGRVASSETVTFAGFRYFGWLSDGMKTLRDSPLKVALTATLRQVAQQLGVSNRRARVIEQLPAGAPLTLKETGRVLEISPNKVRMIAVHLSLTDPELDRRSCRSFSRKSIEQIRRFVDDLVDFESAASLLALSPRLFGSLCKLQGVSPFIRIGGTARKNCFFTQGQIGSLRAAVCKYGNAVLNPHATAGSTQGRLVIDRLQRSRACLSPGAEIKGMSVSDASAFLGIPVSAVSELLRVGHLRRTAPSCSYHRVSLEKNSVEAFNKKYVAAKRLASTLRCPPKLAYEALVAAGVNPASEVRASRIRFVEAESLQSVLRFPDAGALLLPENDLWASIRVHLARKRLALRLVAVDGAAARIGGSTRKCTADLLLAPDEKKVSLSLKVDRMRSPRRYTAWMFRSQRFRPQWNKLGRVVEEDGNVILTSDFELVSHSQESYTLCAEWAVGAMLLLNSTFLPRIVEQTAS